MSFEFFTGQHASDELNDMFQALRAGGYAVSTLPYLTIDLYIRSHGLSFKLRRLKSGKTKIFKD